MSMKYIRTYYKVPAKRGKKVIANGQLGVITGSRGAYLKIRLEGQKNSLPYHPTWEMQYIDYI
ncbi:hypothetical protein ACD661_11690 [Legionella lytica]|uniref:Uncharacterized protein n=1 Tax=Legionella lytica TaxID=96232 RepID=A0ABW8DCC5_9GAMM